MKLDKLNVVMIFIMVCSLVFGIVNFSSLKGAQGSTLSLQRDVANRDLKIDSLLNDLAIAKTKTNAAQEMAEHLMVEYMMCLEANPKYKGSDKLEIVPFK
jgi:hypothetical protein